MAPAQQASVDLERRYSRCNDGEYCSRCYDSKWCWIGRWVLLGVLVFLFLLFLVLLFFRNRRRRRLGQSPMYGTGWMGNWGNSYPQQYPQHPQQYPSQPAQYNNQAPPPQYAQYTGGTYDSNQGYYANHAHNNDIPLQPPAGTYYASHTNEGADEYAPPTGPPPGKK